MTVYVDNVGIKASGRIWYHLISDTNDNEIHIFAKRIGLKRSWFHVDHYDVTTTKRIQALKNGAVEASREEIVGIRRKKRNIKI
jgi:hypothetical protein